MYHLRDTATYLNNKKKLLYLAVFAGAVFLIVIGVPIEQAITNSAEQEARMYQTALKTDTDSQLNHAIDTKQGNVLAPVTVKSVDLVKFPEMYKEYSYVYKEEERYTQHTRVVCTTDSDGNQQCHTETYYTWDTTNTWRVGAKEVEMAGRKYPFSLFSLGARPINASEIIKGETGHYVRKEAKTWIDLNWGDDEGDIRYSYSVLELPKSGTAILNLSDGLRPLFGSKIELHPKNPDEIVKSAQKSSQTKSTVFTVFWVILILGVVGFGVYAVYTHEDY